MPLTRFQGFTLFLSGVTALGIGAVILFAPQSFYAGSGIALGDDVNLLSELRAPAAGLAALGALMLAGILRSALRQAAIAAALIVYLAFPAGRLVGLITDGMPNASILTALLVDLALGVLCLIAFRHRLGLTAPAAHSRRIAAR